jgi:hypothetical protein
MSRRTNSRVAGASFLIYIAAAFTGLTLYGGATSGKGAAAKLANLAGHASQARVAILLTLVGCFCAVALAVTLYAITRDQDPDLALVILTCRAGEGVLGAMSLPQMAAALWLATVVGPGAPDAATAGAIGTLLLIVPDRLSIVSATFFAVGSLAFCYLIRKGRIVPLPLAWIGVVASILVVAGLPLELAGVLGHPVTDFMWLPMLAFEVPLGIWLIAKGAAAPLRERAS